MAELNMRGRWKYKVAVPKWTANKLIEVIKDVAAVDQSSIETTYAENVMLFSFDVVDNGFHEWLKSFLKQGYGIDYSITYIPEPELQYYKMSKLTSEDFKNPYEICGEYWFNKVSVWKINVSMPTQEFTDLFTRWRYTDMKNNIEIIREFSRDNGTMTDLSFICYDPELFSSLCDEFKQKGFRYKIYEKYQYKEDTKMSKVKTQSPTYYPEARKFTKVIKSGPVTVAWMHGNPRKFMIRKSEEDNDDLEKAMLMLYVKSQFSSEASFHRWFRDQMKLFGES